MGPWWVGQEKEVEEDCVFGELVLISKICVLYLIDFRLVLVRETPLKLWNFKAIIVKPPASDKTFLVQTESYGLLVSVIRWAFCLDDPADTEASGMLRRPFVLT